MFGDLFKFNTQNILSLRIDKEIKCLYVKDVVKQCSHAPFYALQDKKVVLVCNENSLKAFEEFKKNRNLESIQNQYFICNVCFAPFQCVLQEDMDSFLFEEVFEKRTFDPNIKYSIVLILLKSYLHPVSF